LILDRKEKARSLRRLNKRMRCSIAHLGCGLGAGLRAAPSLLRTEGFARQKHQIRLSFSEPASPPAFRLCAARTRRIFRCGACRRRANGCASCHSPDNAYGPPTRCPVMPRGPNLGIRVYAPFPCWTYLERQDRSDSRPTKDAERKPKTCPPGARRPKNRQTAVRVEKTGRRRRRAATNIVPQGGLFWAGRAGSLQNQAIGPCSDPRERMAQHRHHRDKILHAPYAPKFAGLFGPNFSRIRNCWW